VIAIPSRYALDTDHVTFYLRGHPRVVTRLQATPLPQLTVPIVTIQELLAGWLPHVTRRRPSAQYIPYYHEMSRAMDFFCALSRLDFDARAATEYSRLRTAYPRLGTNDLRIAAIAFVHQACVVTANTADFGQIAGLTVEDWSR
jgi:tRNA(fMet)-specific endonuclease VapC